MAILSPGHIRRRLPRVNRAKQGSVRCDHGDPARTRTENIPLLIDLEPIRPEEGIFPSASRIEEDAPIRDRTVRVHLVREPGRPLRIDIRDVESFLIR